jgi:hypothetical protein
MCGVSATVGVWSMSNITQQYVAKYGVPAVAKKVFIRIQQMNDYLETSSILPVPSFPLRRRGQVRQTVPKTMRNHSEPIGNL